MSYPENLQGRSLCIWAFTIVSIIAVVSQMLIQPISGYLDIKQYCRAFDENFQPIICIIKNKTNQRPNYPPHPPPSPLPPSSSSTHFPILQPPPGPDYIDYDEDEDDCTCEVTCVPRIIHQRTLLQTGHYFNLLAKRRDKRTASTSYRCRSCGTECSVSTARPPTCYCAIPATKSECTCTATCARFHDERSYYFQHHRDGGDDDASCILSVTALEDWRLGEERPPYVCECKRSKEAEDSSRPDFICICQRIPISRTWRKPKT